MEVGLGFAGTGAIIVAAAGLLFLRARHIERESVTTPGEVVALAESTSGEGRISYAPVIQFTTAANRTIKFTDRLGTNPPSNKVGDRVTVSYDPDDPDGACIAGSRLFLPMLLAVIGAAFLAGGLIVVLVAELF